MSSRPRALIIGIWGDPSRWQLVEYAIPINEILHKGIKNIAKGVYGDKLWKLRSRSSTLAITCFYKGFMDVKTLIFGLDSIANLSDNACKSDVRECARSIYRSLLARFVKEVAGENTEEDYVCSLEPGEELSIELVVTPARGSFAGYKFSGTPIHIFNVAFAKVLRAVEEFNPRFVIVDVTHGINYQTISVLHAAVAVAQLVNSLERLRSGNRKFDLIILNSEPYLQVAKQKEIRQEQKAQQVSTTQEGDDLLLSILDVTELKKAVDFINTLSAILYLRLPPGRAVENEELPREISESLRRLVVFVKIFENSAIGITYPGSFDEDGKPLNLDICSMSLSTPLLDLDYKPVTDITKRVVTYDFASTAPVMLYTLSKVISGLQQELCTEESKKHLRHYLYAASKLLKRLGLEYAHQVVQVENTKWGLVEFAVTRLVTECRQGFEEIARRQSRDDVLSLITTRSGGDVVEISSELLAVLRGFEQEVVMESSCRSFVEEVLKKVNFFSVACRVEDENARNMYAHAGLSHNFMKGVKLLREDNVYRVAQLTYIKCLVENFLTRIAEEHI